MLIHFSTARVKVILSAFLLSVVALRKLHAIKSNTEFLHGARTPRFLNDMFHEIILVEEATIRLHT